MFQKIEKYLLYKQKLTTVNKLDKINILDATREPKKFNLDRWIVPPGLVYPIHELLELINTNLINEINQPIILCGDTGVGKTLFTDIISCIFKNLGEKNIRRNFAAIEKNLIAIELFGHMKGSFTGAYKDTKGILEEADQKLLIIVEIGELSFEDQSRLLTFLEDGYFYRAGSTKQLKSNVILIGTTHQSKERFREDFWHRLQKL
jgi:two-component system, NtrC family, response regulator